MFLICLASVCYILTRFTITVELLTIFPAPHDVWLRVAGGAADHRHVGAFAHHHVRGCHVVDDHWWHCEKQKNLGLPFTKMMKVGSMSFARQITSVKEISLTLIRGVPKQRF